MLEVVDLSHHQPRVDFVQLATDVPAVFLKATEGVTYTDPRFADRRHLALSVRLLTGAYCFGIDADPDAQADHFLATAGPTDLLALDVERNPSGASMTLAQAERFVERVHAARGRYPLVYGGGDYLRDVLRPPVDSVLGQCKLWWARYSPTVTYTRLPACWQTMTLWQYTSKGQTAGVGKCDRSRFAGGMDGLLELWGAPMVGRAA